MAALAAFAAISAFSSILGGIMQNKAANTEAGNIQQQAQIALQESRQAAAQRAYDVTKFQSEQAHKFASSGITLEGSPAMVLEETRRLGQQEVDSLTRSGNAKYNLLMLQSQQTKNAGRAALIGAFAKAGQSALGAYTMGKSVGVYGNTPTTLNTAQEVSPFASSQGLA